MTTSEPKITVCIPVFNLDVGELVVQLQRQIKVSNTDIDIVLIDDCSDQKFSKLNATLTEYKNLSYIQLEKNIGRSAIRNLFLNYCTSPFLIFLDCDSIITDNKFLEKYAIEAKSGKKIVCGGRIYGDKPIHKKQLLHWRYGKFRESKSKQERQKFPNKSFMTNNFMIDRNLLQSIRFDERISKYGHEDTLFGYRLKQQNITITHIDNPVLHNDIENCDVFIEKTEQGIKNLCLILRSNITDKDFEKQVDLIIVAEKFNKKTIKPFVTVLFGVFLPLLKSMFLKGHSNLFFFNVYKLGYFCIHCYC